MIHVACIASSSVYATRLISQRAAEAAYFGKAQPVFGPRNGCICQCRADESIAPYLPANKRGFIFGSMTAAAAQFAMWLLPDMQVCAPTKTERSCT